MTNRHELLRAARKRSGLPGREVAHMVAMDAARMYKLESGSATVTEETIRRYVAAGLITRDEAAIALLGEAA